MLLALLPLFVPIFAIPRFGRWFRAQVSHGYQRLLTQWYLPFLGGYRIAEVSGLQGVPREPCVLVSNHRGNIDALLLLGFLFDTAVVIKSKYARYPIYRALIRYFDYVCIDSSSPSSMVEAMERCSAYLARGKRVLIFPEGSRSVGRRMLPFRKMAFKIAADAKVPIVPVVLYNRTPWMAKGVASYYPRDPVEYRIRFLEVMDPTGTRPEDLMDRTYHRMTRELRQLERHP